MPTTIIIFPVVLGVGVEPTTLRSSGACSTNWAIQALVLCVGFEPHLLGYSTYSPTPSPARVPVRHRTDTTFLHLVEVTGFEPVKPFGTWFTVKLFKPLTHTSIYLVGEEGIEPFRLPTPNDHHYLLPRNLVPQTGIAPVSHALQACANLSQLLRHLWRCRWDSNPRLHIFNVALNHLSYGSILFLVGVVRIELTQPNGAWFTVTPVSITVYTPIINKDCRNRTYSARKVCTGSRPARVHSGYDFINLVEKRKNRTSIVDIPHWL